MYHQEMSRRRLHTYEMGMNEFSDWTDSEIHKLTGSRPNINTRKGGCIFNTVSSLLLIHSILYRDDEFDWYFYFQRLIVHRISAIGDRYKDEKQGKLLKTFLWMLSNFFLHFYSSNGTTFLSKISEERKVFFLRVTYAGIRIKMYQG